MENNKISISLTTVIIIAVIIGAFILGIISYITYNNINKSLEVGNDKVQQSTVNLSKSNETSDNNDNQMSINKNIDNNTNTDNNTIMASTKTDTSMNATASTTINGKESSKKNPLSIGEWGIVSKKVSGQDVDVPVSVTALKRGSGAAQEIKEIFDSDSSIYRYEEPKENMEWAIIEYSVDLTKIEERCNATLYIKIIGTQEDNDRLMYKDSLYIVTPTSIKSMNYGKGEIVPCKSVVQLPIGCTDYIMMLYNINSNQKAYFYGI